MGPPSAPGEAEGGWSWLPPPRRREAHGSLGRVGIPRRGEGRCPEIASPRRSGASPRSPIPRWSKPPPPGAPWRTRNAGSAETVRSTGSRARLMRGPTGNGAPLRPRRVGEGGRGVGGRRSSRRSCTGQVHTSHRAFPEVCT